MTGTLPRRGRTAHAHADAAPGRTEDRACRLAEDATRHIPGVYAPAAVTVRADGQAARVYLDLLVGYGEHLPTITEAVRRRVAARIEAHTGLPVQGVTITVVDVVLPGEEPG
ncbi:Asp23 family, cell envelope-related function [Micromonospora rhizosphaerae]|uniref:Asp23 family, cell envelope-related function n=1 Tax=Micromonospora rhizosphaerae TaxID=568872 RepID=A0A1C6SUU8_9ACTN|nr:Asp23/Gls24 family envelope stress response protein [Micromonospora rhizosphaerae]SCL33311.1 Asp23 family, cell envelope-related function [Micromonospora rhizosphaerae]